MDERGESEQDERETGKHRDDSAALAACSARDKEPEAIVLWAWERPEDLRFLKADSASVAVLAATILLNHDRAYARPRRAPLQVRPGTPVTAVVRIEMGEAPALDERQRVRTAGWIREIAQLPQYAGLQIDFDAPLSARPSTARCSRSCDRISPVFRSRRLPRGASKRIPGWGRCPSTR
ncbi:MAG: hypothetical protein R2748_02830 [Bryobacterales bacterium]